MSELLSCFSHSTKRRLLNLFMNECFLTVSDCQKVFQIKGPLAVAHLTEIMNAGIIEKLEFNRKNIVYYIDPLDSDKRQFIRNVFDLLKINDKYFESDLDNYTRLKNQLRGSRIMEGLARPIKMELKRLESPGHKKQMAAASAGIKVKRKIAK